MKDATDITSNFVVMSNSFDADVVPVTDSLYAELDERYGGFAGHALIACHTFDLEVRAVRHRAARRVAHGARAGIGANAVRDAWRGHREPGTAGTRG